MTSWIIRITRSLAVARIAHRTDCQWPSRSSKADNFYLIWKGVCHFLLVINMATYSLKLSTENCGHAAANGDYGYYWQPVRSRQRLIRWYISSLNRAGFSWWEAWGPVAYLGFQKGGGNPSHSPLPFPSPWGVWWEAWGPGPLGPPKSGPVTEPFRLSL